jgi:hypothetical protein
MAMKLNQPMCRKRCELRLLIAEEVRLDHQGGT